LLFAPILLLLFWDSVSRLERSRATATSRTIPHHSTPGAP
jgi:hypothetical protein